MYYRGIGNFYLLFFTTPIYFLSYEHKDHTKEKKNGEKQIGEAFKVLRSLFWTVTRLIQKRNIFELFFLDVR